MVVALLGRLRSEEGDRIYVFPVVNVAKMGRNGSEQEEMLV